MFFLFFLKVSFSPVESQETLSPHTSAPVWRCGAGYAGCLELCAGRWFGGGHDLHVLGKDGLEGLVSVDHGTEHQWLQDTEMLGN